jgi:hypothetical protein
MSAPLRSNIAILSGAIAVVAVSVVLVVRAATGDDPAQGVDADGVPVASADHAIWGRGTLTVELPAGWVAAEPSCDAPEGDGYVTFAESGSVPCSTVSGGATSTVTISSWTGLGSGLDDPRDTMTDRIVIHGATLRTSRTSCRVRCTVVFGSKELDTAFAVTTSASAQDTLDAIVSSVRVLPSGFTTVPYLTPGTALVDAEAALTAAGFTVSVDGDQGLRPTLATISPHPGAVVRDGASLKLALE